MFDFTLNEVNSIGTLFRHLFAVALGGVRHLEPAQGRSSWPFLVLGGALGGR